MRFRAMRRVARTEPALVLHERGDGTNIIGHCKHIVLECGHIIHGNPIMAWRDGETVRCRQCDRCEEQQT